MLITKQSYKILGTPLSLKDAWDMVEAAARNCYRSERNSLVKSSEEWCKDLLIKHPEDLEVNHLSPLEFGTIYLSNLPSSVVEHYRHSPYNRIVISNDGVKITTNLRFIIEHNLEDDLQYAGPPSVYHKKFWSFLLHTCIHVYKDLTRHRSLSFAIESTRYCNYTKDKFGGELSFVLSPALNNYTWEELGIDSDGWWNAESAVPPAAEEYLTTLKVIENTYNYLIKVHHWTPQEAAELLPQSLAAHVMFGGYEDNLDHMFRLRADECSGKVHPLVTEIMVPLKKDYESYCRI